VEDDESSPEALTKALHWTYWTGGVLSLVMIIFWPVLAIPAGVFTKGYFYLVSISSCASMHKACTCSSRRRVSCRRQLPFQQPAYLAPAWVC
jgi:hypothetical protein